MSDIPRDWFDRALFVTGDFETIGDPWTAVSGDFDKMGISCGPQQVSIGSNSLQPLVLAAGEAVVRAAMPRFGGEMWDAAGAGLAEGLRIVRSWQNGTRLKPDVEREIKALLATPEMRDGMRRHAARNAETAFAMARAWDGGGTSRATFCWFFDVVTQNGGLKGLTRTDVDDFKAKHGTGRVDDLICDALDDRPILSGHDRDAHRNAALWRNAGNAADVDLLVLSYLRSLLSKPEWRHVVMNRKGTLAMRKGFVNGERYDLD